MRDLEFDIRARDATAEAFDSARRRSRDFNAELDRGSRSFDEAASRARNYSSAIRSGGHETANLAAQLHDVGVSLAGGQSPLLVAVQQGSQITQILGPAGAAGAVALLRGAFLSVVSPVSLATIAIIAGGGYVAQYFAELLTGSENSEEALKREAQLVEDVATKWGDVLPHLRQYLAEKQRLSSETAIGEATGTVAAEQFNAARQQVADLKLDLADLMEQWRYFGAPDDQIVAVQRSFADLERAVKDSSATAEDAARVQAALMTLFTNTGLTAVGDLASRFHDLAGSIAAASQAAANFRFDSAIRDFNERNRLGVLPPVVSGGGQFLNPAEFQDYRASQTKSQFQLEQEAAAPHPTGAASNQLSAARDQETAYQRVVEQLREERAMLGLNATEQRILSEQRRAGVSAASEQGKAIEAVVRGIEAETERLDRFEAQQREVNDAVRNLAGSALDGVLAWAQGAATAEDAARGLASEILRAVSYAALLGEGPLAGLFGGGAIGGVGSAGGGGLVGLLLGGATRMLGGGAADPWAGFRAQGGPVDPFKTYVVGEKGPELLRMGGRSGYVVPNGEISALASSQRPVSITFNVTSPDAPSFVKSRGQIETLMARAVARGQRGL